MAYHLHIVLAHTQILLSKLWVFEKFKVFDESKAKVFDACRFNV